MTATATPRAKPPIKHKIKITAAPQKPPPAPDPNRPPRIASITISNNRSDTIGPALESVLSRVDVVVLVDTGITDATIEVARRVAGDKLRVVKHAWRNNFAAARNAGMDFARAECEADWAVMIDTDERIDWRNIDLRAACHKAQNDCFYMTSGDGTYIKEKVFRLSAGIRYVGDVHEVPIACSHETLPAAVFEELQKNNEQIQQKYQRDAPILMDMVKRAEFLNDGRWWYYLGDTLFGLNNLPQAVQAFAKCVELRQPISEDGAWAAFRQAECLCVLNRFQEALEAAARGLSRYPGTGELAWIAAYACSKLGWNEAASHWAHISITLGRYAGVSPRRGGFLKPEALYEFPYDILRYALPTENERAAATEQFNIAKRTRLGAKTDDDVDRLGITRSCRFKNEFRTMLRPPTLVDRIGEPLPVINLALDKPSLEEAGAVGFQPLNPSTCVHNGKLYVLVRTVNYTIENGNYVTIHPDGCVRTVNLLGRLNLASDKPKYSVERMRDKDTGPRQPTRVLGYEDIRLFSAKGKLWGSATVRDRDRDRCQIALLEINPANGDIQKAHIQQTDVWTEKNWMPILDQKDIRWVYGMEPLTTRDRAGKMEMRECNFALDHQRGGSHVLPFDDGYLCITHETIHMDGWGCRRIYLHRFIRLDAKIRKVTHVSRAFTFEKDHYGIEFCSSLSRNPGAKGRLIIGYGVEDKEAKLVTVTEEQVRKLQWWTPEDCK